MGPDCVLDSLALALSIPATASSASIGVDGFRARLTTRVGGLESVVAPPPTHYAASSPILVFSEKKIRSGSWEETDYNIYMVATSEKFTRYPKAADFVGDSHKRQDNGNRTTCP